MIMKTYKKILSVILFSCFLLLLSLLNAQQVFAAATTIHLSNPQTEMNCYLGDINCRYQSVAIISNATTKPLYNASLYVTSGLAPVTYTNQYGVETSGITVLPGGPYQPGEEIFNTIIKMVPPQQLGTYYGYFYADGKNCNIYPDCYYMGAAGVVMKINMLASQNPTSTPTPTATPTPVITNIPQPTATPTPTIIPTQFGIYQTQPASTEPIMPNQNFEFAVSVTSATKNPIDYTLVLPPGLMLYNNPACIITTGCTVTNSFFRGTDFVNHYWVAYGLRSGIFEIQATFNEPATYTVANKTLVVNVVNPVIPTNSPTPIPTLTPAPSPTPLPTPVMNLTFDQVNLPSGKVNRTYSGLVSATDDQSASSISMNIANLPKGLSYNSNCVKTTFTRYVCRIGGIPTQTFNNYLTITLTDNFGRSAIIIKKLVITNPPRK